MGKNRWEFAGLTIDMINRDATLEIVFEGKIDESFIPESVEIPSFPSFTLNMEKVKMFNSCGIRSWLQFVSRLRSRGTLAFQNCSIATVDQFNMIPASYSDGMIYSFYAPYYCKNHGELTVLVDTKTCFSSLKNLEPPQMMCERCGEELEFDALADNYFGFVESIRFESD